MIVRPLDGVPARQIGGLLYFYALWVGLLFVATYVALHLGNGRPLDLGCR